MRPSVRALLILAVWYPLSLFAGEPKYDVNVNVLLTDDGKKLTPPTKANPAYYYPIVAGYTELGPVVAGETIPDKKEVLHMLARVLANQGYRVALPDRTPPATLFLVCRWGYMNPDVIVTESEGGDPTDPVMATTFRNQDKMLALVSGLSANLVDPKGRVGLMSQVNALAKDDAEDDRYFVIVTAYEAAAFTERNEKKMLWQARISTPSSKVNSLNQIMPTLINTGGPFFGKDTMPPHRTSVPVVPAGNVDIGTATVLPESTEKR